MVTKKTQHGLRPARSWLVCGQRFVCSGVQATSAVIAALGPSERDAGRSQQGGSALMGIINCTPDSFSDGGTWVQQEQILAGARAMCAAGASLLDVGGESTRPGASEVSAAVQLERVLPALATLRPLLEQQKQRCQRRLLLSIDTRSAQVAQAALKAGAEVINDVSLLADPAMAELAAATGAGLILCHSPGNPKEMQALANYRDVVDEVRAALWQAAQKALSFGVKSEQIVLDPGIGFGKSSAHNLALLASLEQLRWREQPLLVGISRKRLLGELFGLEHPQERDFVTAMLGAQLARSGADILRVHNVELQAQALQTAQVVDHLNKLP